MADFITESEMREAGRRIDPDLISRVVMSTGAAGTEGFASIPETVRETMHDLATLLSDYQEGRYRSIPYWAVGTAVIALLSVIDPQYLSTEILPGGSSRHSEGTMTDLCLRMVDEEVVLYRQWCRKQTHDGRLL